PGRTSSSAGGSVRVTRRLSPTDPKNTCTPRRCARKCRKASSKSMLVTSGSLNPPGGAWLADVLGGTDTVAEAGGEGGVEMAGALALADGDEGGLVGSAATPPASR